jgi:hypothetical protein
MSLTVRVRAPSGQARIEVNPHDPVTQLFERVTDRFKVTVRCNFCAQPSLPLPPSISPSPSVHLSPSALSLFFRPSHSISLHFTPSLPPLLTTTHPSSSPSTSKYIHSTHFLPLHSRCPTSQNITITSSLASAIFWAARCAFACVAVVASPARAYV